jgi:hypothetical protein
MSTNSNTPAKKAVDSLVAAALVPEERELGEALIEITQRYGKFNSDDTGVWAGYVPESENDIAHKGVNCANCILYEGGSTCKIIVDAVEPMGRCRFALIPDGIVSQYEKIMDAVTCPMCASGCKCTYDSCNCPDTCDCGCRTGLVMLLAAAARRAPKKDRIYGSKKNKPGSAAGGKKIVFSERTETALRNKVKEHNEKAPAGRKATLPTLKAVYRRGAGAYSSSHRPGKTRDQWAMARVNAYLRLLRSGRPSNPNYKQDNDLLPAAHPRSSRDSKSGVTASAAAIDELFIEILGEDDYESPEHAIVAMAEFSGLGYEVIPALKAAWLRAVDSREDPFSRALDLATSVYNSQDADLLPHRKSN